MTYDPQEIIAMLRRSYLAVDGLWFVMCEQRLGFQAALELDGDVWKVMPKIQARRAREVLGLAGNSAASFASACHGAGRRLSRQQAAKQWKGRDVAGRLEHHGILVRAGSMRGLAEEAPAAYKDVHAVVQATEQAGLARRVAALRPLICLKG